MRSIQFRNDINALRALAVTAVVLFHYKVSIFRGGFVGVDVFFVISGYLMTSIITRRLDKNTFTLLGFYRDRARRIVPPLAGTVLTLTVLGYFFIDPFNYQKLASSGVSALLFFSNFRFWGEAGYFDAESSTKWFLHTWSLSVEWQFYLIFPILMWALYRLVKTHRALLIMLWVITLGSLAASIAFSTAGSESTFYLLPFRAWELLAGGIVALQFNAGISTDKRISYGAVALGLALILYAVFSFNETMPWPSYWALIPVAGTCLVIAAWQSDLRIFTNPVCRTFGDWSYSIYLWHWPIAVAAYYFGYATTTPLKVASEILVLAALIGFGGYLVTSAQAFWTAKAGPKLPAGWQLAAGGATFALALLLNGIVAEDGGITSRAAAGPELLKAFTQAKADFDYPGACDGLNGDGSLRPCQVGQSKGSGGVLFIGDSQAMQIYARFNEALARKYGTSFTFLTAHGCAPMPGVGYTSSNPQCTDFVNKAFAAAASGRYSRVVLVSRWVYIRHLGNLDALFAAFAAQLEGLKKQGISVAIVSATPVPDVDMPQEMLRRKFFGYSTESISYEDRRDFEKDLVNVKPRLKLLAKETGADFIDPLDYLCADERCAMTDENGDTLFWDQSHFRGQSVKSARFKFLDKAAGLEETAQVK